MSHKFNVADTVRLKNWKKITGRILLISISLSGVQYEVRFFDGQESKSVWLFEDEIEGIKQ